MQDGGGALRIRKLKAVGSNPTATTISLFIISLFFLIFIFVGPFYVCKEART